MPRVPIVTPPPAARPGMPMLPPRAGPGMPRGPPIQPLNIGQITQDLKLALSDLIKTIDEIQLSESSLRKLVGIIVKLGRTRPKQGFFAHIESPQDFETEFINLARPVVNNLLMAQKVFWDSVQALTAAERACAGRCPQNFIKAIEVVRKQCNAINVEIAEANKELQALENQILPQLGRPGYNRQRIVDTIKTELKREDKGLVKVLRQLAALKRSTDNLFKLL
jgi:hypothetical protein